MSPTCDRRAYNHQRYVAHREEARVRSAAYRAADPERERARCATYQAEHRDAIRAKHKEQLEKFTEWLQVLRTNNGCEDCETHEGRLEHHHVDPSTKKYDVSRMDRSSLDSLEEELEKCAVLCVPCHNKRHVALRANARAAA